MLAFLKCGPWQRTGNNRSRRLTVGMLSVNVMKLCRRHFMRFVLVYRVPLTFNLQDFNSSANKNNI